MRYIGDKVMNHNKIGVGILVLTTLLVGMVLIPAVSAQEEKDYSWASAFGNCWRRWILDLPVKNCQKSEL